MAYWLVKSEPSKYSWENFKKDKITIWDGIRSYAARNNLKAMKKGDEVFFYHSNEGLEIVGIAEVYKEYYKDISASEGDWVVVELKAKQKLKNSVTLKQIKENKHLVNIELVKLSRLSVSKISPNEWDIICQLGTKI